MVDGPAPEAPAEEGLLAGGEDERVETVPLDTLRPHPRNYRTHPPDQLAHIVASIRDHGIYRNIVIARDGTILAGHGVALAARQLGMETVPVKRLDIDPNSLKALKVLAGDNETARRAEQDDRELSEILKQIKEQDAGGLLGTGYDDQMLANLVFVTRTSGEVADYDAAAEWTGMPEFAHGAAEAKVIVNFASKDDQDKFLELIGATVVNKKTGPVLSIWWPERTRQDLDAQKWDDDAGA